MPSNVLPLHLKQTFPPIIWIFTEVEGDGIESKLPFKIFSTLQMKKKSYFFNSDFIYISIHSPWHLHTLHATKAIDSFKRRLGYEA